MAADERELALQGPVAFGCVKVGVADAGKLDIDKDFVWTRFGDGDFLVYDGCTVSVLLEMWRRWGGHTSVVTFHYLGPLFLGYISHGEDQIVD